MQGAPQTKMLAKMRKKMLLQQLDLYGLGEWSTKNQAVACALLEEYHDIFSLDPGELDCTNLAKHEIRVVDDEPFKERFWRIPLPMVKEAQAHVKERLETDAIWPSQTQWCNAIVLVWKRQRSAVLYQFLQTKWEDQERFLPTPRDTRSHQKSSWCRILFLFGFESQVLANSDGQSFQAIHCFYHWELWILWVWMHTVWAM